MINTQLACRLQVHMTASIHVCNGVWIQHKTYKSQRGQETVKGLDVSLWLCSDRYAGSWELMVFLAQQ